MRLTITALPCASGATYYRRAGRLFYVGQTVELDATPEVEAELRASKRLKVAPPALASVSIVDDHADSLAAKMDDLPILPQVDSLKPKRGR